MRSRFESRLQNDLFGENAMNKIRNGLIAMLAAGATADAPAGTKKATLRMSLSKVDVDFDDGIIRNCAVATVGPASGWGFDLDATTLNQLCTLINGAGAEGYKVHFRHPKIEEGQIEDQLGKMVGRLKNARVEGASLRADVHLGEYAKNLPEIGNVWDYLLGIADEDPTAIGLSVVMCWKPDEEILPERIVARVEKVYQIDFVDDPAANPNGLLSRRAALSASTPDGVKAAITACVETARTAITEIRALRDAITTPENGIGPVETALAKAGAAAQAVTVAARACIDMANAVLPGSMVDESAGEAATVLIRVMILLSDECNDATYAIDGWGYGSSEFAHTSALCSALLQTCFCTIYHCQDRCRPLTYPIAIMAQRKNAEADRRSLSLLRVKQGRKSLLTK
jgi:hypothetical protein